MDMYKLKNGILIPKIGFGTAALPKDAVESIIGSAYDNGYRLFDTAWHYFVEEELGRAFQSLNIRRDEIFLTSKLHFDDLYPWGYKKQLTIPVKSIRKAFDQSCKRLKTDYLDLYLIHFPFRNYLHMWEEIQKIYETGRVRAIGVCSFEKEHLESLKNNFDVFPDINQFEISPYNTRKGLIHFCQREGIQVEAYSAFGVGRNKDVVPEIMSNIVLKDVAHKYGKSVAQVILRWLIQQNIIVIPRSKNPIRQKENIDVFNFSLNEEEMSIIDDLNIGRFVYTNPAITLK